MVRRHDGRLPNRLLGATDTSKTLSVRYALSEVLILLDAIHLVVEQVYHRVVSHASTLPQSSSGVKIVGVKNISTPLS